MQYIFEAPVSRLSLGQTSYNLLREMWKRGDDVGYFPIGNVDLAPFQPPQEFVSWLQDSINRRYDFLKKDVPTYKMWHIQGSDVLRTPNQKLLSFHETDFASPVEKTIVNLQDKTFFCGHFSKEVFQEAGCENVDSFNLGLDEDFVVTGKKYLEGKISWSMTSKFERRKNTEKIINLWVKKYGNSPNHSLNLCVTNPFFSPEDNQKLLASALENKRWYNVNILPPLTTNKEVVELTNATDIDLSGASFSESWNIPAFNATALGKWSIVTNYGGHKSWATSENSVMIEPDGMKECYDGWFFHKGQQFNQGNFCSYSDEALVSAFETAEKKVGTINKNGLDLGKQMTYSKTLESILSHV